MKSRSIENMGRYEADWRAKKALKEVKNAAEEVLHQLDISYGVFELDKEDEIRWKQLRDAILQFRVMEITPSIYEKTQNCVERNTRYYDSEVIAG